MSQIQIPASLLVDDAGAVKHAAPPADPWAHRSQGMRCKTCMWFVEKANNVGRCRRNAPTISGYPVVFVSDWCGDHKLDETKVPA